MDFQKKLIPLLLVISIFFILISGCTYIVTPDNNYDDDYDSYTVSYIRVSPSSADMKVNTSTYFTPEKTGVYLVFAHYKEKWDYSSVDAE